jgi:hypothetical protein
MLVDYVDLSSVADHKVPDAPAEWFPNAILVQVTMQQKCKPVAFPFAESSLNVSSVDAAPRTPESFLSHVQGEVLDILQYGTETWFARNSRNEEGCTCLTDNSVRIWTQLIAAIRHLFKMGATKVGHNLAVIETPWHVSLGDTSL